MKTQVIQDHKGMPTGVFIPIKDWEKMKKKYHIEEPFILSNDQKKELDNQKNVLISEYQDGDNFIADLKKEYDL